MFPLVKYEVHVPSGFPLTKHPSLAFFPDGKVYTVQSQFTGISCAEAKDVINTHHSNILLFLENKAIVVGLFIVCIRRGNGCRNFQFFTRLRQVANSVFKKVILIFKA